MLRHLEGEKKKNLLPVYPSISLLQTTSLIYYVSVYGVFLIPVVASGPPASFIVLFLL